MVFLGPDEQIIPQDIEWIISRAKERGYPFATAFMSSKPLTGINHKVYGVTSEGVAVYLNTGLRALKLLPTSDGNNSKGRDYFTVKLTGGTDGDVGGNMIKILHRDYGPKKCKVVGIADGTAAIEDPNGVDLDELAKMAKESVPLSSFPPSKLSSAGAFHLANTPQGARARNTLHNRVIADVFVPCGGRPQTINERNWRSYLIDDDVTKPSSKLIVEGANLFLTPKARDLLSRESGVVVIKDSSANKCGVICSAYEVICSMLLSETEFIANKEEIVKDVLVRLRTLARLEAELLFREQAIAGGPMKSPLPDVSVKVSAAINIAQDTLANKFTRPLKPGEPDVLMSFFTKKEGIVYQAMPKKISQLAWDRIPTKVPRTYLAQLAAANIASEMVYQEGTAFVDALNISNDPEILADLTLKWGLEREKVSRLAKRVLELSDKSEDIQLASKLLDLGGARAAIEKIQ